MKHKTKAWIKAAGVRALKTAAQAALAVVGTSTVFIHEINWLLVLSASALAGVLSMLTSLAGLPEVDNGSTDGKHFEEDKE